MKIEKKDGSTYITADEGFRLAAWNIRFGCISHYHNYGDTVRQTEDFKNDPTDIEKGWYYMEVPFYEGGRVVYEEDVPELEMKFRIIQYESDPQRKDIDPVKLITDTEYHVECQHYEDTDKLKWIHRYGWIKEFDAAIDQLRRDIQFYVNIREKDKDFIKRTKREDLCVLVREEFVFNDDEKFKDIVKYHKMGHHNCLCGTLISKTNVFYSTSYHECEDMLNQQYQLVKREIEEKHYPEGTYSLQDWTDEEGKKKHPDRITISFDFNYKEPADSTSKFTYRTIFYSIEVLTEALSRPKKK